MVLDPITGTVIHGALVAAADEMLATLKKTALSPVIYEVLDAGTGVTCADGQLLSSGAGIPSFIGVLDKTVSRILQLYGKEAISDGDVFITNDPYFGGVTHLNDMVLATPVFACGQLVAWVASIAHWSDVGGMTAGSMSAAATEIFQEGLRLPAVRLFAKDKPVESVFEIIETNSRLPEFARGDLWAQIAAGRRARDRIELLIASHGIKAYQAAAAALLDEGEQRSLTGLAKLPCGTHSIEEEQDDGALWQASITIASSKFTVDLRGNPPQRSAPHNTSRDGAVIAAQMIFKSLCDPQLFANSGSFRALEVITEPGSVFHAIDSAAHGFYFETRIRLYDMLWQCLAQAFPDQLPAGHFASICGTVISGNHPDTQRRYTMVEPQMGGWGACAGSDGQDAMYAAVHGDTFNCPAEICEARYGITVGYRRLNGRACSDYSLHRGGRGLEISYLPRTQAVLSAGYSRNRQPVWGLHGGAAGGINHVEIARCGGAVERYAFIDGKTVAPGDEIRITTANGGGWGSRDAAYEAADHTG